MDTASLTATLALVGAVILLASLLSGFIERSGLPQVAVFLALGAALGSAGLGVLNITLTSPALRVVATLSLALVLFTDAISLDISEVRRSSKLALLVLGPGTLLSAALVGLAGWGLLGLTPAAAAILGAALASTDPVLLRGLLRRPDVPGAARQALRLESGLNDVVLLPIVLVAVALLEQAEGGKATDWAKLALDLFLLGPAAGVIIGLLATAALDLVRSRIGIRRDYESLYSLGVAFAAFAAAEAVHGSGFLAVFAAGLTIAALDVELCDCFLEYGETTAEMALLFTFVLFGSSLIWSGFGILSLAAVVFVLLVILIRPVAFLISLAFAKLKRQERLLIAWFGPRGLSSLLLVLLAVFEDVPGGEKLFQICALVVLASVVIHGSTPSLFMRKAKTATATDANAPVAEPEPTPPPLIAAPVAVTAVAHDSKPKRSLPVIEAEMPVSAPPVTATASSNHATTAVQIDTETMTIDQLRDLWQRGEKVLVVDARSVRSYEESKLKAQDSVRLNPDFTLREAARLGLPHDTWLAIYCT